MVEMEKGDIMLLHTDGVTEASHAIIGREGGQSKRAMFGADRLRKILSEQKDQSTDEIKQRIVNELADYLRDDDVTLVILKRL